MVRTTLPLILAAVPLGATVTASALDEQGYWAFGGRMQAQIDRYWGESAGLYTGFSSGAHSDALLTLSWPRSGITRVRRATIGERAASTTRS